MDNAFFFQTQQIYDDRIIFDQLKEQNIFFSYFFVDQNYYIFIYAQQSIDINLLYQSVEIIQELDSKQRKIRSLRGFFLYALEIIENAQDYEILSTNLQPFFWKKVKNIIRQNTKSALLEFLFGKGESNKSVNQVSSLAQQVERLQHKVLELEAKLMRVEQNLKYPLSKPSQPLEYSKTIQQGHSTLKSQDSSYSANWVGNQSQVNLEAKETSNQISESLSEDSKNNFKRDSKTQQYNLSSPSQTDLNGPNLITSEAISAVWRSASRIPEEERIEIIQKGFQRQAYGTISLKKYYESKDPDSLFEWKGYNIKYETIRRTKLYQNLKE